MGFWVVIAIEPKANIWRQASLREVATMEDTG
jgi:hypothetical protein